jgi:hypothetical protein
LPIAGGWAWISRYWRSVEKAPGPIPAPKNRRTLLTGPPGQTSIYDAAEPRERVAAKAAQRIVALDLQRIDRGGAGGYGRGEQDRSAAMLLARIDGAKLMLEIIAASSLCAIVPGSTARLLRD